MIDLKQIAGHFMLLILLVVSTTSITSTNVSEQGFEALKKCVETYLDLKKFSVDVEYAVFYDADEFSIPNDKRYGKVVRFNDNFYQEEIDNIKVLNKDYEFYLTKESRVMTIFDRHAKDLVPIDFELDSMRIFIDEVSQIKNGFQFHLTSGAIEKFDLIITKSGYLHCMRNYYREKIDFGDGPKKVVTQIRYYNFVKNPAINQDFFSLKDYVSIDKFGNVNVTAKYKNYHLINNIKSNG